MTHFLGEDLAQVMRMRVNIREIVQGNLVRELGMPWMHSDNTTAERMNVWGEMYVPLTQSVDEDMVKIWKDYGKRWSLWVIP